MSSRLATLAHASSSRNPTAPRRHEQGGADPRRRSVQQSLHFRGQVPVGIRVFRGEPVHHERQVRFGGLSRGPGLREGEHREIQHSPELQLARQERHRRPDVGPDRKAEGRRQLPAAWERKSGRHDPNHRVAHVVEPDLAPQHGRVRSKAAAPGGVGENRDRLRARLIIIRREGPPQERRDSQGLEKPARDLGPIRAAPPTRFRSRSSARPERPPHARATDCATGDQRSWPR